jgi:hypothetical protein
MVDDYLATKEHTTVDVVFEMDVWLWLLNRLYRIMKIRQNH